METSRLRRENQSLKRKDIVTSEMLGNSAAYRALIGQLDKVTKSNGRVMLSGPAGSGKEIAARYIHAHSNRAQAPFVTVNCAGVAPDRMEEVLFGRESADRGIEPGLLEQAHGGVIYFDEVADMPLGTQSKILRVLVDQQFTRVGGNDKVRVDLRVISSTNRDLAAEIEAERFRQELYHRLNVVPIAVPSLADRREDIPLLAEHFIAEFNRSQGLPQRALSDDALALMQTMVWPGNVRQLKNLVERVLILGEGTGPIEARELPGEEDKGEDDGRVVLSGALATLPLREAREAFEREYLLTQINRFGGNISRTANFVGMERSALHRKLKSLGVVTSAKSGCAWPMWTRSRQLRSDPGGGCPRPGPLFRLALMLDWGSAPDPGNILGQKEQRVGDRTQRLAPDQPRFTIWKLPSRLRMAQDSGPSAGSTLVAAGGAARATLSGQGGIDTGA